MPQESNLRKSQKKASIAAGREGVEGMMSYESVGLFGKGSPIGFEPCRASDTAVPLVFGATRSARQFRRSRRSAT